MDELTKEEIEKRLKWYESQYGPYIEKRGLRNWKNLLRKPSSSDWIILVMLVMVLFITWAYRHDTAECRSYILRDYNAWLNITNGTGVLNYGQSISNFSDLNFSLAPDDKEI